MIAPKVTPENSKVINIAASIATSTFNDGAVSYLRVLEVLGAKIGGEAYRYVMREDAERPEVSLN